MKLNFLARLAIFLIDLISKTWRFRINGSIPSKPAIIVFWHGSMLPGWKFFELKSPYSVVSLSKDGEILSHLLKKWNFSLIRGSSSNQGKEVLNNIVSVAKNNYVLMTPDGPQGPYHKFKAGAAVAGMRTGTSLILCGISVDWKFIFKKSWDKFELPLPFSKINLSFSEPIFIAANSEHEEINQKIFEFEKILCNLSSF